MAPKPNTPRAGSETSLLDTSNQSPFPINVYPLHDAIHVSNTCRNWKTLGLSCFFVSVFAVLITPRLPVSSFLQRRRYTSINEHQRNAYLKSRFLPMSTQYV